MRIIIISVLILTVNVFAQTDVSGTIDGEVWTSNNSPYNVIGDIIVNNLKIQEDVIVKFTGDYVFEVTGILTAIGTAEKPIKFAKPYDVDGWQGIYLNFCNNETKLIHCFIEGSINSGIIVDNCSPVISNCTIQNNSTTAYGGGIFTNSDLTLDFCKIKSNKTNNRVGGGIYSTAFLTMINCLISGNNAWYNTSDWSLGGGIYSEGGIFMKNCTIESNNSDGGGGVAYKPGYAAGGGLFVSSSNANLENCIISSNSANAYANTAAEVARGGGIYVASGSVVLTNCIVCQNSLYSREYWGGSEAKGGGIYIASGSLTLINSTVAYNGYEGIIQVGGFVSAKNSIFYFNTRSQISGGQVNVAYCDVEGGFDGENNIAEDPIFMGDTGEDIKITSNSPCVDKGDPNSVYNDISFPPSHGTERNDMGAHGGPGAIGWIDTTTTAIDKNKDASNLLTQFSLEQNYPNPFNPSTTITFNIPKSANVKISIYDILGREIKTLVNKIIEPGRYKKVWDGRNNHNAKMPSGTYLIFMQSEEFVKAKKIVLVR